MPILIRLRWAHISFCWFCRAVAQMYLDIEHAHVEALDITLETNYRWDCLKESLIYT